MAALAGMTVVVEAAARSGSLITADLAADLGRDLGAVPGPVTSRASAGPNNLLAGGACVVRDAQDVLDAMLGAGARPLERAGPALDPELAAVLAAVEAGEASCDGVAAALGLPAPRPPRRSPASSCSATSPARRSALYSRTLLPAPTVAPESHLGCAGDRADAYPRCSRSPARTPAAAPGIQADLKAFARCGVHGMTAITAITAQNTVGVEAVEAVSPEMIVAQVRAVAEDIGVDAVKIGMLGTAATVEAVVEALGLVGERRS